jgi:hypothetical protein
MIREGVEPVFYQSDSPCRRCNGTLRYKNTAKKGACASCVTAEEGESYARNYILRGRAVPGRIIK